jgi:hypothetical protein
MAGIALIDPILDWFRHRKLQKNLQLAKAWPTVTGEVNQWSILEAEKGVTSFATPCQIEAAFHFTVAGEYYGGYFRSVGLDRKQARDFAKGNPSVVVRYDPANPDTAIVLAEDNSQSLQFRVLSDSLGK